ncbi:MAG: hypothetical protein J7L08_03725 [Candidatus Aenigmarchaeota archaeon]|nr:hypothetical protein [Candidatus Aenigmarchaeota archaeon]
MEIITVGKFKEPNEYEIGDIVFRKNIKGEVVDIRKQNDQKTYLIREWYGGYSKDREYSLEELEKIPASDCDVEMNIRKDKEDLWKIIFLKNNTDFAEDMAEIGKVFDKTKNPKKALKKWGERLQGDTANNAYWILGHFINIHPKGAKVLEKVKGEIGYFDNFKIDPIRE